MSGTIYALSSGRPPAAIAVIRVSGRAAHEAGAKVAGILPDARQAAVRELRHPSSGELLDEALVLRFDGPASATGEDIVEFHCHGGRAVVDGVLDALASVPGLREALAGEFTRRAFENGRIDLTEAEGLADLLEAETEAQRKAALAVAEGGLKRQITTWQEVVLRLSAEAERAIDYAEDDVDERASSGLTGGCAALARELESWLERPRAEPLRSGAKVVIAGPPNAGKSSLINTIAGSEKAIVTEVPGTTRDQIEVPLSIDGVPIVLTDTAGLRDTDDTVEAIGIGRAKQLARTADLLVWLGDDEPPPTDNAILVHAKADLPERASAPEGRLGVSGLSGAGVAELLGEIARRVRQMIPQPDQIALNRRQWECIADAHAALTRAGEAGDGVIVAEELRWARAAFDRLTGRSGVEDMLDSLFSRFCLGK